MANLKRKAETLNEPDGARLGPKVAPKGAEHGVAQAYSQMALAHSEVTLADRRAFPTSAVRTMNNFVKACILDGAAKSNGASVPFAVLDLAAGRGQDQAKFMYAAEPRSLAAYYAVDLSREDTVSAQLMAEKYLSRVPVVSIRCGDLLHAQDTLAHVPSGSITAVSCQMALHYFMDRPSTLDGLFSEITRVLQDHGVVLVSFTDGGAIVRRARAAGCGTIVRKYYTVHMPRETLEAAGGCEHQYGLPYTFTLPGSVEGVPEYLTDHREVDRVAALHGLHAGLSLTFDEAASWFGRVSRLAAIGRRMGGTGAHDPDAWATAALYRFKVYAKDPRRLAAFDAGLLGKPPPPPRAL